MDLRLHLCHFLLLRENLQILSVKLIDCLHNTWLFYMTRLGYGPFPIPLCPTSPAWFCPHTLPGSFIPISHWVHHSLNTPQFVHSTAGAHLDCFQCLAIMNALLWTFLYKSLGDVCHSFFLGKSPLGRMAGSQGERGFKRSCQTSSKVVVPTYTPTVQSSPCPVSLPRLRSFLSLFNLLECLLYIQFCSNSFN